MADGIKIRELDLTNLVSDADVFVIDKLNNITGENLTFQISFNDIKKNYLGDVVIDNPQEGDILIYDGDKWVNTSEGTGGDFEGGALIFPTTQEPVVFVVTVGDRTAAHRFYNDTTSDKAFYINDMESPSMAVAPGRPYRFDTSDSSCENFNFLFYVEPTHTTAFGSNSSYQYNVSVVGTPGAPGSYTEVKFTQEYGDAFGFTTLNEESPRILFYNCAPSDGHDFMGNGVFNIGKIVDVEFDDGTGGGDIIGPFQMAAKVLDLQQKVEALTTHVENLITIE